MALDQKLCLDVLTLIARSLKGMEDFSAFRLSCTSLRNAATLDDFNGLRLRRNVPYLMVPAKDDGTECEFFSLAKEKIVVKATLPKSNKWIESQGWLLTFGGNQEKEMSLVHPFEHLEIKLPNEESFPDYHWIETLPQKFIKKMVLSSQPFESSDFAVVVIYGACRQWGFWKPGNRNWTRISAPKTYKEILDVTYFDRQFFAINSAGQVWACDVNGPNPAKSEFVVSLPCNGNQCYLVKSSGMLLVVAWHPEKKHIVTSEEELRSLDGKETLEETTDLGVKLGYKAGGFDLFEVNTVAKTWEEIKDLGDKALFIGHSASLLVEATRGIKPNHIYYAGNEILLEGNEAACCYSLKEQRIDQHLYERNSTGNPLCPVWVAPIF